MSVREAGEDLRSGLDEDVDPLLLTQARHHRNLSRPLRVLTDREDRRVDAVWYDDDFLVRHAFPAQPLGGRARVGDDSVRRCVRCALECLQSRRFNEPATAADTGRDRRHRAAGQTEDVRVQLARVQNRDLLLTAPLSEGAQLACRCRPAKTVNGEERDRFTETRDAVVPDASRVEADGVDTEATAIEPGQQLDHLTLRPSGRVSVDEYRNGNLCRHGRR